MKNATKRNEIEHYETQNIFDLIINEINIKKKVDCKHQSQGDFIQNNRNSAKINSGFAIVLSLLAKTKAQFFFTRIYL